MSIVNPRHVRNSRVVYLTAHLVISEASQTYHIQSGSWCFSPSYGLPVASPSQLRHSCLPSGLCCVSSQILLAIGNSHIKSFIFSWKSSLEVCRLGWHISAALLNVWPLSSWSKLTVKIIISHLSSRHYSLGWEE